MIDLQGIVGQIGEATRLEGERRDRVEAATNRAVAHAGAFDPESWDVQISRIRSAEVPWKTAHCNDLPAARFPCPVIPQSYVAMAVDGSQVAPDRHEGVGGCYLLNASQVVLSYGTNRRARLKAVPRLMILGDQAETDEDSDGAAQDAAELSMNRYAHEMSAIRELLSTAINPAVPSIALTDGSLIAWHLYDRSEGRDRAKKAALDALLNALATSRESGVPVVGYISDSRARDVISALRITLCPEEIPSCIRCRAGSGAAAGEPPPCQAHAGVTDTDLFRNLLNVGERSPIFTSYDQRRGYSQILKQYDARDWIDFFYLNVDLEIARIEIPRWVAQDPLLVDRVHAICFDQACKGRGYPVALAEAHERAVLRGADREAFLNCLRRSFVQSRVNIDVTRKAVAKRSRAL